MQIKKVHVVYKTHLDVGFTDYAANIVKTYFESFIPRAVETAYQTNAGRTKPAFLWTTGSWLIHEYLRTQPADKARAMEEAIGRGYIAWHALPFTTHTELMDERLLCYGLSLSEELDRRFGRHTVAAKMTDVPGHTIGIVRILADHGVRYLHIGVNGASAVPDVPGVFVWRDGCGNELIVNYAAAYGAVQIVEGLDEALAFAFTGDNLGPCTAEQVMRGIAELEAEFPGAEVCASTLDDFANAVWKVRDTLPVVTREIGDTWIHGVGTDPVKVAQFRELLRLRSRWVAEHRMDEAGPDYQSFSGKLLLVPEHTWGMDLKTHLPDYTHYSKPDFTAARKKDAIPLEGQPELFPYLSGFAAHGLHGAEAHTYSAFEASWKEQRGFVRQAVESLSAEKRAEAEAALSSLRPSRGVPFDTALAPGEKLSLAGYTVRFGEDGSIAQLEDGTGRVLSTGLASFLYQTYGAEQYTYWFNHYVRNMDMHFSWASADFGKPGMEFAVPRPEAAVFRPEVKSLSVMGDTVRAIMAMPEAACETHGAPRELQMDYVFGDRKLAIGFCWFRKDANRLPEALWLSFCLGNGSGRLKLRKLGCTVSAYDVVSRGNRNLHACERLSWEGTGGAIGFTSMDAPLVATKGTDILKFDDRLPEPGGSFHVNLYNNIWGTNFPMWFEEDCKFRFELYF